MTLAANHDETVLGGPVYPALTYNHNEALLVAGAPPAGGADRGEGPIGINDDETLPASAIRRGLRPNHSESVLRGPIRLAQTNHNETLPAGA